MSMMLCTVSFCTLKLADICFEYYDQNLRAPVIFYFVDLISEYSSVSYVHFQKFCASVQALCCYCFVFSFMISVIFPHAHILLLIYCSCKTDNIDHCQQVIGYGGVEGSQEDAVEVDAEDDGVEESQDEAEVEAEGSTDGAVLVNGNSSEEQWGTKNEEPSA